MTLVPVPSLGSMIREKGVDKFSAMAKGLEDSINGRSMELEIYWHSLALRVDDWSKVLFFGGYTIIIFGLYIVRSEGGFD